MAQLGEDPFEHGDYHEPPEDDLSDRIIRDGVEAVRKYFDDCFWRGQKVELKWEHLRIALRREDRPMLQLLISRGASATEEDLAGFREVAKDKYQPYMKLLRQCGLKLPAASREDIPAAENEEKTAPLNSGMVPEEWRRLLLELQAYGAGEAVIAGAALRDLFNDRAVDGVDIFLRTRGSAEKNRTFLKAVFRTTGLEITEQETLMPFASATGAMFVKVPESFPSPERRIFSLGENGYATFADVHTVVAGRRVMKYNIVFVDSATPSTADVFASRVLGAFDFGINQIAGDGRRIITTPFFVKDVAGRQITQLSGNIKTDKKTFKRLVEKYPGWRLHLKPEVEHAPPKIISRWADHHGPIG